MADELIYRLNVEGLTDAATQIGKLDTELIGLGKTVKQQREALKQLEQANQQGTETYKTLTQELGQNIVQQRTLTKAKGDLIRETQNEAKINKENEGSIVSLRAQLSNLTKEYNSLTKAERESVRGQDVQKQAKAVSDQLKTLESAIGDNRREVGNYRGALSTLETDLKQLIAQQQKLINSNKQNTKEFRENEIALKRTEAEYKKIFVLNQQVNNSFNQFNQQINNSSKTVNNYGLSLKQVGSELLGAFGIGFGIGAAITGLVALGRQIAETGKEVKNIEKTLTQIAGLTGDALDEATVKVRSLAGAFDKDFNEILISTTALSKQFGITATEALDLIQDGFVNGADANGEFLQTLKEYPAQFKAIGITAQQSIDIITQSANQGIYSDKGVDTIKEAGLALREQTKATQDALKNAFGAAFTDELLTNINSGSVTLFEAIQSVSTELSKLEPQSKEVGAVIADVFKGAGEDAGLAYLVSLKDIGSETKELTAETKKLIEEQERQLRLNEAQVRVTNELGSIFNDYKNDLIGYADTSLTIINQGSSFEKYFTILTGGFLASSKRANELRDELKNLEQAEKERLDNLNTTDIDEIVLRIANLNEIIFAGADTFGFSAKAIEFYNKRLIELGNTTNETSISINNLESLQKKLTAAQEEFNKVEIGTKRFEELRGEIKALQAQIEAITNPTNKGSINALTKELAALSEQASNTTDVKKLQALQQEIAKLEVKIRSLQNLNENLSEDFTDPLPDPNELKATNDANIAELDRYAKELAKIKGETQIQFDDVEQDPIVTEDQLRAQNALEVQLEVEKFQSLATVTQDGIALIQQIQQAASDREIARINQETQARIDAVNSSVATEEEKAEAIAKITAEQEAKLQAEREASAKQQRNLALAQIAIETAKGISSAVAAGAGLVFPANIAAIASGIASVLAGIASATAAIQSAKFEAGGIVEKYASGGEIPKGGGFIKGNSHANGGVKFAVGGRVMEAEGGEIIVNKGIQKRPDFVKAISEMNAATGGKRFFAAGGVVPQFQPNGRNVTTNQVVSIDSNQVAESVLSVFNNLQVVNVATDTSGQVNTIAKIQNIGVL